MDVRGHGKHMASDDDTRSGEEAIDEIREKREDEDISRGERELLESERVRLDPDDSSGAPIA
jgi:hypothetical protein